MALLDDITCNGFESLTDGLNVTTGADPASREWLNEAVLPFGIETIGRFREKYQSVL